MAAVMQGIVAFDTDVHIGGVVLNRVAGARHQSILTRSIEEYTGVPVLGAVPKLRKQGFPERHMGLVPTPEHNWAKPAIDAIRDVAEQHLDLERIQTLAETAAPVSRSDRSVPPLSITNHPKGGPCIGILKDSAFQFYYPENLEALEAAGAKLVYTSPLTDSHIPPVDGLYIGGGFPETHAQELEANKTFRDELKHLAADGLPIYAECGGLMYLGEKLHLKEADFDMAGVLPAVFGFSNRPQGHGYTIVRVDTETPISPKEQHCWAMNFIIPASSNGKGRVKSLPFPCSGAPDFFREKTVSASTTSWRPTPISMLWEHRAGRQPSFWLPGNSKKRRPLFCVLDVIADHATPQHKPSQRSHRMPSLTDTSDFCKRGRLSWF
jgi:cobyrinic acid a,c-diamide synthase